MKRRTVIELLSLLSVTPKLKSIKRLSRPKPKTWLIAVGTSACKLGMSFYKQNRYNINFHGIDSTNNCHDSITWYYDTRLTDKLLDYHDHFEDAMEEDWQYNVNRHYYEECMRIIAGNVIVLSNLGGKTGSFVTHKLVTDLIKIKELSVTVLCSTPIEFWSGEQGTLLAKKCCDLLKNEKIELKVFDFNSYITAHPSMNMLQCFKHMNNALIDEIALNLNNKS